MTIEELDTVVLSCELAEQGLAAGDIGTVVARYGDAALEVEFVRASGRTQALVTLEPSQIRAPGPADMSAVRRLRHG